jgi:hypothetical protein
MTEPEQHPSGLFIYHGKPLEQLEQFEQEKPKYRVDWLKVGIYLVSICASAAAIPLVILTWGNPLSKAPAEPSPLPIAAKSLPPLIFETGLLAPQPLREVPSMRRMMERWADEHPIAAAPTPSPRPRDHRKPRLDPDRAATSRLNQSQL